MSAAFEAHILVRDALVDALAIIYLLQTKSIFIYFISARSIQYSLTNMPPLPPTIASTGPAPEASGAEAIDALAKYGTFLDSVMTAKHPEISQWFDVLQACDHFRQMPVGELLALTRELVNRVDVQCTQVKKHVLQPWATHLLHLTKIVEHNASTSVYDVRKEVKALAARAHAFERSFDIAKEYISQRMESEGTLKIASQDDFAKYPFHQVLTSTVLSLCMNCAWKLSMEYLFESSYLRWVQNEIGIDKFLIDKKLDKILKWIVHPLIFQSLVDWSTDFPTTKMYKFEEVLDFLLGALNGNGHYQTAKDFIIKMHTVGKSCSGSLVVETIRGLLSEGNGTLDNSILKQMTAIPQPPPTVTPASGSNEGLLRPSGKYSLLDYLDLWSPEIQAPPVVASTSKKRAPSPGQAASKPSSSYPVGDKPPKKRSRKDQ
ncbi:hypothetical protein HYPSUDRAFT_196141 [Hypholoma sublateritium FD-334 SS-4]|uniref:Uncharacterized protein n=1 Tax=Hypholoma sublateritium (strain FD-334 SS-4) TaxID=945553 RepID=A0A0D2LP20_HYPSF|nr:hypothetical protein HYPSUDRAFT_196141 [Hypholoma sublateritium FD-334 SS-4]